MRKIRLILDTEKDSIGYQIDVEAMTYACGGFDEKGGFCREEESGEIQDPTLLAKRLYLVINAALSEPRAVIQPEPEQQNASQ